MTILRFAFVTLVFGQLALAGPEATFNDAGVYSGDADTSRQTIVTSTRAPRLKDDAVVATEVITRAQIEQLGVRDAAQLLAQSPGIEMVYTNRGIGVRLQGLDPEYVLILVDGQRVAGRAGAFVDISRFSLREIDRVEIVKGPAAAVYGADAMGGVINFITRQPEKNFEGALRGSFGTLLEGDVRGHAAAMRGPFSLRGGAGYRTRQSYDWNPNDAAVSGPGIRRIDGDVEAAYSPSDRLRTWVRSGYVLSDFDAVDQNDSGAVFDRFQRTEQLDVWAGVNAKAASGSGLTARGHFGLFRDQFLVDQRGARALDDYSANVTRLYEGLLQGERRFGFHQVVTGIEGLAENLSSSRIDPSYVSRGRVGVYVNDEWVPASDTVKVAVSPGIRLDVDTQFGVAPSPRLAIKIDPLPQLTVRGSWGLGFRPPSFSELYLRFSNPGIGYIVRGNAGLKAEHSGSVNLAVEVRLPIDGWTLSSSAWHTSLVNLINVSANSAPNPDDPATFTYENVANAYTQGIEVSSRMRLSKGVYVDLGYMGLDARDVTRNRPLEGRSNHRVNGQLTMRYRPSGLEGVLRATWHSERPYYPSSGLGFANVLGFGREGVLRAPAYFDLEVQVTYVWRQWLRVFVNGSNLLNSGDQNFNPRPPRGVMGGVMVEY